MTKGETGADIDRRAQDFGRQVGLKGLGIIRPGGDRQIERQVDAAPGAVYHQIGLPDVEAPDLDRKIRAGRPAGPVGRRGGSLRDRHSSKGYPTIPDGQVDGRGPHVDPVDPPAYQPGQGVFGPDRFDGHCRGILGAQSKRADVSPGQADPADFHLNRINSHPPGQVRDDHLLQVNRPVQDQSGGPRHQEESHQKPAPEHKGPSPGHHRPIGPIRRARATPFVFRSRAITALTGSYPRSS